MNRQDALSAIKRRQVQARAQAAQRRRELLQGDAAYARLCARRDALMHALLRGEQGENQAQLLQVQQQMQQRVRQLLQEQGKPQDYLQPRYACERCGDTGMVDGAACSCLCRLMMEGRPGGVDRETRFENDDATLFADAAQRAQYVEAAEQLKRYAAAFERGASGLLLFGASGLGKSFLLGCVANAVNARGYSVRYLSAFELNERFRARHMGEGEDARALLQAELLVIDDLGAEPMFRNITIEYLLALLDARARAGLPVAAATNLSPRELMERYGERVVSRLQQNALVLRLHGRDLRAPRP